MMEALFELNELPIWACNYLNNGDSYIICAQSFRSGEQPLKWQYGAFKVYQH